MESVATNLSVEVHCLSPIVEIDHPIFEKKNHSKYQIYINDDLITERDWIWDQNTYICEHMLVELSSNSTNIVKVNVLNFCPGYQIQLGLGNLIVDGVRQDFSIGHSAQLSFTIA
jgi:hypothetical protein